VAATAEHALTAVGSDLPDVAVLDVNLPGTSGYALCRKLREEAPGSLRIMFLSGERVESYDRVAGLLLGADDYMTKPFAVDELVARLHALARRREGRVAPSAHPLSPREREVLALLADGLRHREIAERLVISRKTVGSHVEHILEKLGVRSGPQAVALALRNGLLADVSAHRRRREGAPRRNGTPSGVSGPS
jgi:DNA-binding NarL/FixJ family response regulator